MRTTATNNDNSAVWEKVTNGRAGIKWKSVVEKVWKDRRKPRRYTVHREVRGVQDRSKINEKTEILAPRSKVEEEEHLEIYGLSLIHI